MRKTRAEAIKFITKSVEKSEFCTLAPSHDNNNVVKCDLKLTRLRYK